MAINQDRLVDTFSALVRIDNPSGQEAAMAAHLVERCTALGFVCEQDAKGNVYGRRSGVGDPILLTAHMDSVAPAEGKQAVVRDGVIYSAGDTVLGADDLAAIAAFLEGIEAAFEQHQPIRAVEVLWTVEEETGLYGARATETERLKSQLAIAFDMNGPVGQICVGSPAHDTFTAFVYGQASHAGVAPEKGISAIQIAAEGIAAMQLGRIDDETTANIGLISGGKANNIIPDQVELQGEARSRSLDKLDHQMQQMQSALETAAERFGGRVEFHHERHYGPSVLAAHDEIVQVAQAAIQSIGITPQLVVTGGGSDVSILTGKGIQAANLSIGYEEIHSTNEHIPVAELAKAAQIIEKILLEGA